MINVHTITPAMSAVKRLGITPPILPELRPMPTIGNAQQLAQDAVLIIRESSLEDPYSDPRVTSIVNQIALANFNVTQSNAAVELRKRAEAFKDAAPGIIKQIEAKFKAAAKALAEHSEPIRHYQQLDTAAILGVSDNHRVAFSKCLEQLHIVDAALGAYRQIFQTLDNYSFVSNDAEFFIYMNPNAEEFKKIKRDPSVWNVVRNDIALTLAKSPEEASERWTNLQRIMTPAE